MYTTSLNRHVVIDLSRNHLLLTEINSFIFSVPPAVVVRTRNTVSINCACVETNENAYDEHLPRYFCFVRLRSACVRNKKDRNIRETQRIFVYPEIFIARGRRQYFVGRFQKVYKSFLRRIHIFAFSKTNLAQNFPRLETPRTRSRTIPRKLFVELPNFYEYYIVYTSPRNSDANYIKTWVNAFAYITEYVLFLTVPSIHST